MSLDMMPLYMGLWSCYQAATHWTDGALTNDNITISKAHHSFSSDEVKSHSTFSKTL